jgi:CRISPR/Cas system-associated exonuclease Cas4 (RecB family)
MAIHKVRTLYWSHLKDYEACPQKYLWSYGWGEIDTGGGPGKRKPKPDDRSMHHAVMGIVIQRVLEDFYNDDLWKNAEFRADLKNNLVKMTRRHLAETLPRFYIDWREAGSFEDVEQVCIDGVLGYLQTMRHHKLMGAYARSEVKLYGIVDKILPLGGRADFIIRREDTGISMLDGKNSSTKLKYVDPDQLRWYALCFLLSYHKLPDRLGFVWFRYPYSEELGETGIDWIDFTKRDLKELVDRAHKVRKGQNKEKFEAKPKAKTCRFCDYESVCPERQASKAANAAKRTKKEQTSLPIFDPDTASQPFGFGD